MTNHDAVLAALAGIKHEHLIYYARRGYEQNHSLRPRRYGVSSNVMVDYALGLRGEPGVILYPADKSDLAACERTYDTAPTDLQPKMLPLLELYREHVWKNLVHTTACQAGDKPPPGFPFEEFSCNCPGARAGMRRYG